MATKKTISKSKSSSILSKKIKSRSGISIPKLAIFGAVFAVVGVAVLLNTFAAPKPSKLERFVNNPGRGWVWDGIRETASDDSPCRSKDKDKKKDLLEIVNPNTGKVMSCTHGPDPAHDGVDVKKRTEPLQTGEDDATALAKPSAGGGSSSGPATIPASPITCDGDGVSGNRVQAIYARASDQPDRYSQYKASIQAWASGVNNVFIESGLQTGSSRSVRFVHDANCYVTVANVVLSSTGDDNVAITENELQNQGYGAADRKYIIWMDANVYCGVGDVRWDDQPGAVNSNNYGRSYARVDNGCWSDPAYAAHEIMHNLGGVQISAPHSSGYWHCTDEEDLMCYADGTSIPMTYPCPFTQQKLFDCNDDDYYHTGTPPEGSYLATHWNTANNIFLFTGNTPPPPTGDTISPVVTISSPADGAKLGSKTSIKASATDNVGVTRYEIWIDGVLKSNSNTYSWTSRDASVGTHTITAKAFDAAGNPPGQKSVTVSK